MTKLTVLSEKDLAILKEMVQDWERNRRPLRSVFRSLTEGDDQNSPDVYIAKPPVGGIPALEGGDEPAEDDIPGKAECEIYQIIHNGDTSPTLKKLDIADKLVYNVSKSDIPETKWTVISRTKTGKWVVPLGGSGGGGEIVHFNIVTVDCDGEGNWECEVIYYSGGCESEVPDADPYTGYIVVHPFCGGPFSQEELEASGAGVAVYTYDLDTCVGKWVEITHCAEQGC